MAGRWQPRHPRVEPRPAPTCEVGDRFASWSLAHEAVSMAGMHGFGVGHPVECGRCAGWHVAAGPAPVVVVSGPLVPPLLPEVIGGRVVADLALPESPVTAQQPQEGP